MIWIVIALLIICIFVLAHQETKWHNKACEAQRSVATYKKLYDALADAANNFLVADEHTRRIIVAFIRGEGEQITVTDAERDAVTSGERLYYWHDEVAKTWSLTCGKQKAQSTQQEAQSTEQGGGAVEVNKCE